MPGWCPHYWCPHCLMGATLRNPYDGRIVRVVDVTFTEGGAPRLHVENSETGKRTKLRMSTIRKSYYVVRRQGANVS